MCWTEAYETAQIIIISFYRILQMFLLWFYILLSVPPVQGAEIEASTTSSSTDFSTNETFSSTEFNSTEISTSKEEASTTFGFETENQQNGSTTIQDNSINSTVSLSTSGPNTTEPSSTKSPSTTIAGNDLDTAIEPPNLVQFYALIAIPRLMLSWPKCLVSGDRNGTVVCEGVCALLYTQRSDFSIKTSYGCQRYENYPKFRINMCSNDEEPYPNVRIYYDKLKMENHVKLCCKTDECNHPDNFKPLLPHKFDVEENSEQKVYEYVMKAFITIVLAVFILLPFYYIWEDRQKEDRKKETMDSQLERAVVLLGEAGKPDCFKMVEEKSVTGLLSLVELSCIFAYMRDGILRFNAKSKEMGDDFIVTEFHMTCAGNGHDLLAVHRSYMVDYEDPIWNIIEHGPYKYPWTPYQLVELFDKVKSEIEIENVLLHISAPVVVIGDIRGQYQDLHRWLSLVGYPPKTKLLFLGSILDESEPGSIDCFAFIMALKNSFPNEVFILRGVGETVPMKFIERFGYKLDNAVLTAINRLCSVLPIAAVISKRILAVHSGICHEIMTPRSFDSLDRPFNYDEMPRFAKQIIFNQPTTKVKSYRFDEKTRTGSYGMEAVVRVCRDMDLRMIIRSRNPLSEGILWNRSSQGNKIYDLVSIWSAPAKNSEKGAIIEFDENFHMKVHVLEKQEHVKITPYIPKPGSAETTQPKK